MWNQYYFDLSKIESVGPVRQKIKLPLPNTDFQNKFV